MRAFLCTLVAFLPVSAQDAPPVYVCGRAESPIVIDGRGDEAAWQGVRELSPLRDIEGAAIPHRCRTRMVWDDAYLYSLADMDEEHLWATQSERDSIIYRDPDFEVFIDPDGDGLNYIELEINALNTVWDLFITRPYRFNDPHILHDWNIRGLKHAVNLRGTLNNPADTDEGWSVELAIPWSSITSHANQPRRSQAPAPGSSMRFNFSRVNWQVRPSPGSPSGYEKLPAPESNHVWAPTGQVNIHLPERWGQVVFSERPASEWVAALPSAEASTRLALYHVLNTQLTHRGQHGSFAPELPLPVGVRMSCFAPDFFVLTATCPRTGTSMRLDSEGRFHALSPQRLRPELYLWVHGNKKRSETEWSARFRNYAEAGITTLIIDGSAEQISKLTPLARRENLRVFAWLWTLNRPGDATALRHPGWYAVNAERKSCHQPQHRPFVEYYQFLCPNNEEVKQHLLEQVRMLATIPGLHGIQTDYMRLPDVELPQALWSKYGLDMSEPAPAFDYCYCPTCMQKFGGNPQQAGKWKEFRLQSVAELFNTLAAEIRSHGLIAACAVFPSPELSARMVHQDWSRFQADLILPMTYHSFYGEHPEWITRMSREAMEQTERRIPLAPAMHLPDIPADELPALMETLLSTGVSGIGLFSDDEITPEHLEALHCMSR